MHKKCFQHFRLSRCLKEKTGQAIQLDSGRQERPFLKIFSFLDSAARDAQKMFPTLSSISLFKEKTGQAIQLDSGRQERPFLKIFSFLDSAARDAQKRFPTLSSISLFARKNVASYTIGQRALGTSVFKNFQFFGFSCSRRTKNVPNTFLYLVVCKKKRGKLYNWIAGARNIRF